MRTPGKAAAQRQPPKGIDFAALMESSVAAAAAKSSAPSTPAPLPTPAALYSHAAMVELMISQPHYTHAQLCAHFGRPASWLASVLASDTFQSVLDSRRHEVLDPSLTATMQERFKALAIRTSNVMLQKLDSAEVTDFMVLKAGEVAIKALGMGQKSMEPPPPVAAAPSTETLAERLLAMMDHRQNQATIDAETIEIKPDV